MSSRPRHGKQHIATLHQDRGARTVRDIGAVVRELHEGTRSRELVRVDLVHFLEGMKQQFRLRLDSLTPQLALIAMNHYREGNIWQVFKGREGVFKELETRREDIEMVLGSPNA